MRGHTTCGYHFSRFIPLHWLREYSVPLSIYPTTKKRGRMATVSLNSFLYKAEAFFNRFNTPHGEQLDNARFANILEIANLAHPGFSGDSLLIGETRYKHILQIRRTDVRPNLGHLLDCGPTGRGKTIFMTSQILNWDFNSIIQDPKAGELFRLTSGAKAKEGKVFVIDPVAPVGHRYDPL